MNIKKSQSSENFKDKVNSHIHEKIKINATQHGISCEKAHDIATQLGVSPKIIGSSADILGIKLNKCQLGLFGCTSINSFTTKLADNITPQLKIHILETENTGRLSCKSTWWISKKLGLEKICIAAACEILGIKISRCQLGAF